MKPAAGGNVAAGFFAECGIENTPFVLGQMGCSVILELPQWAGRRLL